MRIIFGNAENKFLQHYVYPTISHRRKQNLRRQQHWTGFTLEIIYNNGVSCVRLGRQDGQPMFSLSFEYFIAVNFEDKLAIIHEQIENVVSGSSEKYSYEQDQKHNRKYNNITIILNRVCHMIRPL